MTEDKKRQQLREQITKHGVEKLAASMAHPGRCGGLDYVDDKPIYAHEKRQQEVAEKLMGVFRGQSECQYLARPPGNSYKPFYRMLCLMLVPPSGMCPTVSKETAAAILRRADPWFVAALEVDYESFDYTYDNIWGTYNDEDGVRG